tara:strand:- start:12703 stop:12915 length:213 start_codon:yes stop_codon:yes gene_type:complete
MSRNGFKRINNSRFFLKLFKRNNIEFWEKSNFFEFIIKGSKYKVSIVTKNTRKFGSKKWKEFNPEDYNLK